MPVRSSAARLLFGLVVVLAPQLAEAQVREGVQTIDDPVQRFLQRQQAAGFLSGELLITFPLSAYEANRMLDSVALRSDELPSVDRLLLDRYRGEAPGPGVDLAKSVIGSSYRDGEALVAIDGDGYAIRLQPLAYLSVGATRLSAPDSADGSQTTWQNTRGIRAAGHVGPIYFESRLEENQRLPERNEFANRTAPRYNFVKQKDGRTYDYFLASGLVGYRSKFFDVRFGRDRAQWGFGEGSLALSDYAAPFDQLQIRTKFWRLQYTNLYARRIRPIERRGDQSQVYPQSWTVIHQLALDLPGRVQLAFDEITLFAEDSLNSSRSGFELAYLNPIIFYRAVEGDIGSPDNVLLAGSAAWIPIDGYRVYTQFLLDELRLSEVSQNWWGNKWGYMFGIQMADPGWGAYRIRGLDFRAEYTRQRPYLYSHRSESTAFVHSGDLLGHPAGPNSWDFSTFTRYVPHPRMEIALTTAFTRRGRNTATENFGSDPRLSYDTRVSEYDVFTLQGVRQDQLLVEGRAAYEFLPSLFVEGFLRYESIDDAENGLDRYVTVGGQLRWGLPFQSRRY